VKNGDVFYLPRGGSIQRVGTLADFLAQAQAAGY
jgi:hypothetical protein